MDIDRECGSKQGYLSKPEAKRVARLVSARHREGFHLYACPQCGLYHVGHLLPAFLRASIRAIELSGRRGYVAVPARA